MFPKIFAFILGLAVSALDVFAFLGVLNYTHSNILLVASLFLILISIMVPGAIVNVNTQHFKKWDRAVTNGLFYFSGLILGFIVIYNHFNR